MRYRTWPPEGYAEPTAEEWAALERRLRNPSARPSMRGQWARRDDAWVARQLQLVEICPARRWGLEQAAYSWASDLRREANRRKLVHTSLRVLRCEWCSHASERLYEISSDTHDVTDRNDEPTSGWACVRCWSTTKKDGS
jgi:hypothetical protein